MAAPSSSATQVKLLGPVRTAVGDEQLPLGGARQRALLALLAVERGRIVSIDRLAEELWSGDPPAGASGTLRSYVSKLRSTVGLDVVATRRGGYVLELAESELDSARFERLSREGAEALERGAAGLASARLTAALDLWRGPALADARDGGTLALEAARLDELRLVCLEQRLEADLLLGRHANAIPELERLVAEEPLRERFWLHLVLALYRSARQADALEAYRRARTLLRDELGLEPGDELRELERAVLRHTVPVALAPEEHHNLPVALTSFVGRTTELAEIGDLLRTHRLVTLGGLGGAGKTRLAIEVARRQIGSWRGGVWLVDLTAVSDPVVVWGLVAATLDLNDPSAPARETLPRRLRDAELLLVLDNCEHLVEACAALATSLLRSSDHVRVLATSRVTLGVDGEAVYTVDSLPCPDEDASPAELERSEAVRLFVERADAIRRGAISTPAQLAAAGRICHALDGLPLAIELAAARLGVLAVDQVEARLGDRFRLLRSWGRIADPRQHTLEATMDWSYDLLEDDERRLLRRLGTFSGGFTLEAIARVCCGGDTERAIELLRGLVVASLVRVDERRGSLRYRLLETVRQYAVDRLVKEDGEQPARAAHAAYFLELAESLNLAVEAYETRAAADHATALAERENLRAALDWLSREDVERAVRLGNALEQHWVAENAFEGVRRFEVLLPLADGLPPLLLARAHRSLGGLLMVSGDRAAAIPEYERSLELYTELGDEWGIVHLRHRLALEAIANGDRDHAKRLLTENRPRAERLGSDLLLGEVLDGLSSIARLEDEAELAFELATRSLAHYRACGFAWLECSALCDLADLASTLGRAGEAHAYAGSALRLARRMHDRRHTAYALAEFARATRVRGDDRGAGLIWGGIEAEEERAPLGDWPEYREHYDGAPASMALERGLEAGRRLSFDAVVEFALARTTELVKEA